MRFAHLSVVTGIVHLVAMLSLGPASVAEEFTIGSGGVTGIYYPAGGAICRMVNAATDQHGLECQVQSTAGSFDNIQGLRQGQFDFVMAQSNLQHDALLAEDAFADEAPFEALRSVFSLHAEPATIVARGDLDINDVAGLKRRRVDIGNPGSGTLATWEVIEQAMGWRRRDLAGAYGLGAVEVGPALCRHDIDAYIMLVGHPSALVLETMASCPSKLLGLPVETIDQIVADRPYFQVQTIPGGMYPGNPDNIATIGVAATLLVTSDTSEDQVELVARAVLSDIETFKSLHPALNNLDSEAMVSTYLSAPLHPAAARVYQELGLQP